MRRGYTARVFERTVSPATALTTPMRALSRASFLESRTGQKFLIQPAHNVAMPQPTTHFEREVRHVRQVSAWLVLQGQANRECQVLDVSPHGAKVVVQIPSEVPTRFELAFFQGGKRRVCEVIWRRANMLGVKFV
jgi:hypothetical protein